MKDYIYLEGMYNDPYFPKFLVEKIQVILEKLAENLDAGSSLSEAAQIKFIAVSIDQINTMEEEFYENDSEIETVAREVILGDIDAIAKFYNLKIDLEEATGHREW